MKNPEIRIIRVLGIRATDPSIIATVDGHLVKWNTRRDWMCDCLTELDEYECDHIAAVRELIHDRVFEKVPLKERA